jgi:hypothetical protein
MTAAELRALVAQGPAVVMVAKDDMLKLLDEREKLREAIEPAFREGYSTGWDAGREQAAADEQGYRLLDALSEDEAWKCSNAFDAAALEPSP